MRLEGFKELESKLRDLPQRVQNKVLQKAVNTALREAARDIRQAAPKSEDRSPASLKYGRLSRNIRVKKLRPNNPQEKAAVVNTNKAFWGFFLERGTRYISARPWFLPAFKAAETKVLEKLKKILGEGIDREANKR